MATRRTPIHNTDGKRMNHAYNITLITVIVSFIIVALAEVAL